MELYQTHHQSHQYIDGSLCISSRQLQNIGAFVVVLVSISLKAKQLFDVKIPH
jgi:hypothetical protein